MKEVGVEALVEGLAKFLGDMGKINSSLDRVRSHGTLLQKAFGAVGDALSAFGGHVVRIAEYALGKLLADAIQWVTRTLGELIQSTIEAGAEFQILELRLERLNFNDLVNSGMEYNEAMAEATKLTKEQLEWIQALAATTPYDATDVANVYTLARSYSFNADEASNLTETILDFAAGMGLGNTEIERIIVNFGQMVQQGKVTGREMTDLARGAFVPVNDVLDLMKEKTGLSGQAFEDFRNSTEGVNLFLESFAELVDTRFAGAAEKMAQTFQESTSNLKDLIKSFLGLDLVKPILDSLGEKISIFNNQFATMTEEGPKLTELGEAVKSALGKIKDVVVDVIDTLFNNTSPEDFADKVVDAVEKIANWFEEHKMDIVDWVKDSVKWIKETLIPTLQKAWKFLFGGKDEKTGEEKEGALERMFKWWMENKYGIFSTIEKIGIFIENYIIRTIDKISNWVNQNRPMIDEFFKSLVDIIARVIQNLTGQNVEGGTDFLSSILSIIQSIMTFINENKAGIADFIAAWIRLSIILDVIKTIFSFLIGVVIGVVTVVAKLTAAFIFISNPIGGLIVLITFLLTMLLAFGPRLAEILIQLWFILKYYFGKMWESVKEFAANIWQSLVDGWNNLVDAAKEFFSMLWQGAVEGWEKIKRSFSEAWENIKQTATETWVALETGWTDFRQKIGTTLEQLWFIIKYYFNKSWDSIKEAVSNWWTSIKEKVSLIWQTVSEWFGKTKDTILQKITEAWEKVQSIDWAKVGAGMISGMVQGVLSGAASLIDAVVGAAVSAYEAALAALGIASPSKLFMEVGELTMEGMAIGIRRAAGLAAEAMGSAMSQVAMPAVALPSVAAGASAPTQVYNSTRNYNLSIQTSAASEPIIQDFNMLESLGG